MNFNDEALKNREIICNSMQVIRLDYIQSYGVLVVISKNNPQVIQVSENIKKWMGLEIADVLNKKIEELPQSPPFTEIFTFFSLTPEEQQVSIKKTICRTDYEFYIHLQESFFIFEYLFIPQDTLAINYPNLLNQVFQLSKQVSSLKTISSICQTFTETLKEALGFDKVLIYQFLEDQHGKVIAESCEEGLECYLGLHFPKSDVPDPVKALYLKNPLRYIYDSKESPSILIPSINSISKDLLDLSDCLLKGVIPVHRDYINNMHVRTSLSFAIIVEDKLWGLLSCHHRIPKFIKYECRLALEHAMHILSNTCSIHHFTEKNALNKELLDILSDLNETFIHSHKNIPELFLEKYPKIQRLVYASGIALDYEDEIIVSGSTPEKNEIKSITQWLRDNQNETIFFSDSLFSLFPAAIAYKEIASGIIAAPFGSKNDQYILWFRSEQASEVHWAGDPNEPFILSAYFHHIKPRNSFQLWRQEVSGYSKKWSDIELEAVSRLVGMINRKHAEIKSETLTLSTQIFDQLNEEKDEFFRIALHDLRNPIAAISMAVTILQSKGKEDKVYTDMIDIIDKQSQFMLELLNELLIANVIQSEQLTINRELTDIFSFINDICQANKPLASEKNIGIELKFDLQKKEADLDQSKIKEVLDNFLNNAIHFSPPNSLIIVQCSSSLKRLHVEVQDQGPGIPPELHKSIFNRSFNIIPNAKRKNEIHGFGLAICKKFIHAMQGVIGHKQMSGQGSCFYFELEI